MPKAYSGDLRERVIEAVEAGASRHEAAEYFEVSVASAVKWLQRWNKERSAAPKPRGGSVSPLEVFASEILAVVAEQPDLTLDETLVELRKRRIKTSRSSLWRFFDRHDITLKKKACRRRNANEQMWRERAAVGYESKVFLIQRGWCLSTRLPSAPIWRGSGDGLRPVSG